MNYHDAFGVPGVVTRMFNNYGPRQNPRYVTGTIITQALTRETIELGALDPLRDFCFCTDGVRGHLTVAAHGTPGDVYVYGQGTNISMRDWVDLILRVGEAEGFWPGDREIVSSAGRHRPGSSEVMALRVGHEKLTAETGWQPPRLVGRRRPAHDPLVRGQPRALDRPRRLASDRSAARGSALARAPTTGRSSSRPTRDALADVIALLGASEGDRADRWYAAVREPDDTDLIDPPGERVPACEPERLEVVVVDVRRPVARPGDA